MVSNAAQLRAAAPWIGADMPLTFVLLPLLQKALINKD